MIQPELIPDEASSCAQLLGPTPPAAARAVSLAVRRFLLSRRDEFNPGGYGAAVAVSGGADSLALAVASGDVCERYSIPLAAFSVDHGMREGSGEEADRVIDSLERIGFESARVLRYEPEEESEWIGPEGSARDLRYGRLVRAASEWGLRQGLDHVDLLVGHTMDDQAETVLLRLGRGASPSALAAMRPLTVLTDGNAPTVSCARPLLQLRRRDTESFCQALRLAPVQDPSNRADGPWRTADGDALPRAAVRERVLPQLRSALGQDPVPALARVATLSAQDQEALEWTVQMAVSSATENVEGSGEVLNAQILSTYPRSVRARVLARAARNAGAETISKTHLEAVDALLFSSLNAAGRKRTAELPGNIRVQVDDGWLHFRRL